ALGRLSGEGAARASRLALRTERSPLLAFPYFRRRRRSWMPAPRPFRQKNLRAIRVSLSSEVSRGGSAGSVIMGWGASRLALMTHSACPGEGARPEGRGLFLSFQSPPL